MKTLYVDVYFFINFTVDILALYFSALLYKLPTTVARLLASSFVGAAYAVIGTLLINNSALMIPVSVLILTVMVLIMAKDVGIMRKLKYGIVFLFLEILIGGLVYYAYSTLDKINLFKSFTESNNENKKLLVFSLIVLLSIGALKLVVACFGNVGCVRNVKVFVEYDGRKNQLDALVDSGNLAVDPFTKTPVMLVGEAVGNKIFGEICRELSNPCELDVSLKKRIRIIPVSFGNEKRILYGIKPDSVYVEKKKLREHISLIIAIDKEGGSYGGYNALIPLSALENISYGSS